MLLFIIQPILASYRRSMFDELTESFDEVLVFANTKPGNGFNVSTLGKFNVLHTNTVRFGSVLYYQCGIILEFLKRKPNAVFMTADFRAINFWLLLLIAYCYSIPVFSHGQGVYDKPHTPLKWLYRILFSFVARLSSKYICYTESVRHSLLRLGISAESLAVVQNTLVNNVPVMPALRVQSGNAVSGLFFVGRLREDCCLELLFDAMLILKKQGYYLALDVVGDGDLKSLLKQQAKKLEIDVKFHGAIYSDQKVSDISTKCVLGVYPGDAGLSVVHYMSLSLVPVIHSCAAEHMGPEASYIIENENGLLFERNNSHSLAAAIARALSNSEHTALLSERAFLTYTNLSDPSMGAQLHQIMSPFLRRSL